MGREDFASEGDIGEVLAIGVESGVGQPRGAGERETFSPDGRRPEPGR
jgi:hypothetical protein